MIDSHCHLDQASLEENLKEIIFRSKEIGIEKLLTISSTTDSFKKILNLIDNLMKLMNIYKLFKSTLVINITKFFHT